MKKFLCGDSASNVHFGGKRKFNGVNTYVCVFEEIDQPIDVQFQRLIDELRKENIELSRINNQELAAYAGNNKYILCHERDIVDGKIVLKPSNLLRYIYSRTFTKDTLYVDEEGFVIDLTGVGIKDITGNMLRTTHDFRSEVMVNPAAIIDCILYCVDTGYNFDNNIHALFSYDMSEIPKLPDGCFFSICSQNGLSKISNFIEIIRSYPRLEKYLSYNGDFDLSAVFCKNRS